MKENAKDETSGIRTAKGSSPGSLANEGSEGGVSSDSEGDGYFHTGIAGATGTGENPYLNSDVAGGVIEQLIIDAEDRLKVARECIDWYKREEETATTRLENLKQLREAAERQKQKNQQSE